MPDRAGAGVGADVAAEAEDEDRVSVIIDGVETRARAGETIIAAAERSGVYIPRFCYHPRMKPVGVCRMCLVEVKGPRGFSLQPACFVPVAEGQEVVTKSDVVRKAQEGVLEYLLVNHPLDCPVCDKGGECPLQDQTIAHGPGESRFVEEKRHFEKPIAISPLVLLDRERCIQCSRCTRFASELAGDPMIDFMGRGDQIEVNIFPGDDFTSYFSGNTVQICPVGALTAAPYRFTARPWDLDQVESTCTSCALGCRVVVQSSWNRVTRRLGLDSDPVNHSFLCDKGRFDFESISSSRRVSAPLVRSGSELVEVSWSEALRVAASGLRDALKRHGPEAIGFLGGARLANEDAYAWGKLAKAVIGTDSVDAQIADGLPADAVLGLPRATIDEMCSAKVVIVINANLREELPILFLRLRRAALDGGPRIVELAPEPTAISPVAEVAFTCAPGETASMARWLFAPAGSGGAAGDQSGPSSRRAQPHPGHPGSEAAVAGRSAGGRGGASLAYRSGSRVDLQSALSAAQELLFGTATSATSTNPGVAAEDVVIVVGRGSLAESELLTLEALELAMNAFPAARVLPALRRANVMGALDMGLAPGILPGRVSLGEGREWFGEAWGTRLPSERGRDARQMMLAAAESQLGAMVLLGADPRRDFPDPHLARGAMDKVGHVVAVDSFLTESAKAADVVLPAAMCSERPGTTTNIEGRVSRLGHKLVPPGVAWPDWMIAVELAKHLGSDLGFVSLMGISEEIERLAPSHRGLSTSVLESYASRDGVLVPLLLDTVKIASSRSSSRVRVDGGSDAPPVPAAPPVPLDPMAVPGVDSVERQGPLPWMGSAEPLGAENGARNRTEGAAEGSPVAGSAPGSPVTAGRPRLMSGIGQFDRVHVPAPDSYSLRLISVRRLFDAGTLVQMSPSLARLSPARRARVNPHELERMGVVSGTSMLLSSVHARETIDVFADDGVPRGAVSIDFNVDGDVPAGPVDITLPVVEVRLETLEGLH